MDSTSARGDEEVRAEVSAWLRDHWHGTDDPQWRQALAASGWAAPTWPRHRYGRGLSRAEARAVAEEFGAAGAAGGAADVRPFRESPWVYLLGNTLLAYGGEEICAAYLPGLLSGDLGTGCLLYSEPGAATQAADFAAVAALAAAYCTDAYVFAAHQNIQFHGGMGFTWELPAHLYYKRARASQLLLGEPAEHRERLAELLGV
jgi:alkylation response protein AidB-like acyl-CoA dehydrogenase